MWDRCFVVRDVHGLTPRWPSSQEAIPETGSLLTAGVPRPGLLWYVPAVRGGPCHAAPCRPYGTSTPLRVPKAPRQNRGPLVARGALDAMRLEGTGSVWDPPFGRIDGPRLSDTRDKPLTAGPARKGPKITMRCERAAADQTFPRPPLLGRLASRRGFRPSFKIDLQKFARWDCGHEAHSNGRNRCARGHGRRDAARNIEWSAAANSADGRRRSTGSARCVASPAGPLMPNGPPMVGQQRTKGP
jgi:hypothetical protein